ncbi:MAG: hypothetical protein WCG78_03855 [Candidatus Omnitrophota bacterium]
MKNLRRIAVLVLAVTVLFCGGRAVPARGDATGAVPASAGKDISAKTKRVIRPGEIKFSSEFGRIIETYDGGGDKLIVHIQDAHTNYEAQKNAADILEELINKYGLYLILVEGGSRDVSLNHYRENAPLETRKQNADKALREGIIAGEEYLNIASDYPMKLQGIEDRGVYDQNMVAFLGVDKGKDEALAYIKTIAGFINVLKPRIYTKEAKELDDMRVGFKAATVGLADYTRYLDDTTRQRKIDLGAYPNFKKLMDTTRIEKEIDFTLVEKERAEVIDLLSKKMDQAAMGEMLTRSVDFKAGKLTPAQYHNYLKDVIADNKADLKKYPNLEKYIRYIAVYESLDSAALFKELKNIQEKVEQALVTDEEAKRFLRISKDVEFLEGFINLQLSPDDFEYYKQNEGNFNIPAWARFVNSQAAKYKLNRTVPDDTGAIDKVMPSVRDFYTVARKRDDIFMNNAKKYMDAEGVNFAVLIAGGFHTPPLTKLFQDNKISYLVVSPKVLKQTDEKLYHKILTEGWAPQSEAAPAAQPENQ